MTRVRLNKINWTMDDSQSLLMGQESALLTAPMSTGGAKKVRPNALLLCTSGITLVVMFLLFLTIYTTPEFNQYQLLRAYQQRAKAQPAMVGESKSPLRTILFWNSFFAHKRWGLDADTHGPHEFRDIFKCPIYQCELTNNHDYLPDITMYDAVIFHTAQPFPLLHSVPSERAPQQLYVFALMEPPGETKHVLGDEDGFYNLSMTYRIDSDVLWPYQTLEESETGAMVAPAMEPNWRTPPTEWNDAMVWQLWPNKTRMAAWFVSHCETLSKREQLAAALQHHIDVDIYGKCGNLSCAYTATECDELLDERYKFYFSFENSLCNDYVTEKLYNAMKRYVIPVVFGGADYSRFVPPRSVINAEDFDSIDELAEYLKYLAAHPVEYMRYFWWRQYYRLGYSSPYCDLCAKLHSVTIAHKTQTYTNIESWWLANQCRFEAKIKF